MQARDEVGVYDARATFSSLLDRAAAGEEIVITRHGEPVAMLGPAPADAHTKQVVFGWSDETFEIPDDFDDPLPDEFWLGKDA